MFLRGCAANAEKSIIVLSPASCDGRPLARLSNGVSRCRRPGKVGFTKAGFVGGADLSMDPQAHWP